MNNTSSTRRCPWSWVAQRCRNTESKGDNIIYEHLPKKRKNRATAASTAILVVVSVGIIVYGFIENTTIEYSKDSKINSTCYRREEKKTFPVLVNLCWTLSGILLGTLFQRLILLVEERHHFRRRYKGSIKKMFRACFSGISWKVVAAVFTFFLVVLCVGLASSSLKFEWRYLLYIVSGIGVGPLMMNLLSLNTHSEAQLSTILEKEEISLVYYGFAWSYFVNYLNAKVLPEVGGSIPTKAIPVGQGTVDLTLEKLILLIPNDCDTKANLHDVDSTIEKITCTSNDTHSLNVYRMTNNGVYAIKYAKEPLETFKEMSERGALPVDKLEHNVKLFYRTMLEILDHPARKKYKQKCILLSMSEENLANGRLTELIQTKVIGDKNHLGREYIGSMKFCPTGSFQDNSTIVETNRPSTSAEQVGMLDSTAPTLAKQQTNKPDPYASISEKIPTEDICSMTIDNDNVLYYKKLPANKPVQNETSEKIGKSKTKPKRIRTSNENGQPYEKEQLLSDSANGVTNIEGTPEFSEATKSFSSQIPAPNGRMAIAANGIKDTPKLAKRDQQSPFGAINGIDYAKDSPESLASKTPQTAGQEDIQQPNGTDNVEGEPLPSKNHALPMSGQENSDKSDSESSICELLNKVTRHN